MDALQRFLRYVSFETTSSEESSTVPSTPGQKVLGAALVEELTNVFGQFETLWCDELRGLEIDGYEDPCYCVVETVAKKLQELLARCEEEIPHAE